ncbi:salicylate hydroxylase [Xylariales sp. AK1849]|nr:salicylate hydroxylase [Xylariales sp. AK1849]
MAILNVLILGAGPAGLSAAIALSKISTPSNPIQITVVELRSGVQTIGRAVNLTPLALRYLDYYLGAGARLRPKGHKVAAIDLVSLRTGSLLGSLWEGVDALRVLRVDLVRVLLETVREEHAERVEVRFGMRVKSIRETGSAEVNEKARLEFESGEVLEGDVVLGCDGLHSAARRLYVEPGRKETYTGRVVAMGFARVEDGGAKVLKPTGEQAFRSTSLVLGSDGESLKKDVFERYQAGSLQGLQELKSKCGEWVLYPVYRLPPEGAWKRGRVLLLGDAAHAMPPQGESTAFSIEDAVLLAHVLSRRDTRRLNQLFSNSETLRRPTIYRHYQNAVWGFERSNAGSSWLWAVFMEYMWGDTGTVKQGWPALVVSQSDDFEATVSYRPADISNMPSTTLLCTMRVR